MNLRDRELHTKVAKALKVKRLRRDPMCDEFVVAIGSDPTYEEIEQAKAFLCTADDLLTVDHDDQSPLHPDCRGPWDRGDTNYPKGEHARDCEKCQQWQRERVARRPGSLS